MESFKSIIRQSFFIPNPTVTDKTLGDLSGKVVLITGGYTGIGLEICKLLYQKNATVYIAGRSSAKAEQAITTLQRNYPNSSGKVEFLSLDLADLSSIKESAEEFLSKENRLDWLNNNAGVMDPPKGSQTRQGHELQIGTNCLGPYLFTHFLTPLLKSTASSSPENSVRVSWASSIAVEAVAPKGGMLFDENQNVKLLGVRENYGQSKFGNVLLGHEFSKQNAEIVSNSYNPGNLASELYRHRARWMTTILKFLLYDTVFGAYTELYAGFSSDLTTTDPGVFIAPWGRKMDLAYDKAMSLKSEIEGGTGVSEKFLKFCETQTEQFK